MTRDLIVHVSNNFIQSSVHGELIKKMSDKAWRQLVLVPVRRKTDEGINNIDQFNIDVIYINYWNFLRFTPLIKAIYIFVKALPHIRKFVRKHDIGSPVKCLAHNFWSDGLVLFFCSFLMKNIKIGLVVRNTDINVFIPKFIHHRWLVAWMIHRASVLIFVSEAHCRRFSFRWPRLMKRAREVRVIPNGISAYWHENVLREELPRRELVCFVGQFNSNKNIPALIRACETVSSRIPGFELLLAGGEKRQLDKLTGTSELPDFVKVIGFITDRDRVRELFRDCRVFAMPSLTETFGLVYIEALSQGCALVASKNEGIDGIFDVPWVDVVDPRNESDIAESIFALLKRYPKGCPPEWVTGELEKFRWDFVASRYLGAFD